MGKYPVEILETKNFLVFSKQNIIAYSFLNYTYVQAKKIQMTETTVRV